MFWNLLYNFKHVLSVLNCVFIPLVLKLVRVIKKSVKFFVRKNNLCANFRISCCQCFENFHTHAKTHFDCINFLHYESIVFKIISFVWFVKRWGVWRSPFQGMNCKIMSFINFEKSIQWWYIFQYCFANLFLNSIIKFLYIWLLYYTVKQYQNS